MSFKLDNGVVDARDKGRINVIGQGSWDDISTVTWDTWNDWITDPAPILYVNLPMIDLGSTQTVNIKTYIEARGIVHYTINYGNSSNIVLSPANYSTLTIAPEDTDIPSITARYIWIRADIYNNPAQGHQYFDSMSYEASSITKTINFANIDSSTLTGTTASRVFEISGIGGIKTVQISTQGSSNYNVDMYVYHSTTSQEVHPKVISKGAGVVDLTFIGVDGRPRDAVFDIELQVLPEWYIDVNGNLQER